MAESLRRSIILFRARAREHLDGDTCHLTGQVSLCARSHIWSCDFSWDEEELRGTEGQQALEELLGKSVVRNQMEELAESQGKEELR